MAVRKVFLSLTEYPYVKEISVTFPWLNGAKQQNVQAVLDAFHDVYPDVPALEVSLASSQPEGVGAAAMKLLFCLKTQQDVQARWTEFDRRASEVLDGYHKADFLPESGAGQ
jgi:hypothetical protein